MITWNTEIIERLKTGSIKTVLLYGDNIERLDTPYVVVKPLSGESRKLIQIFAHSVLGTQDILEAYILREAPELFRSPLKRDGFRIRVMDTGSWQACYVDEADNTLVMTRNFYIPVVM